MYIIDVHLGARFNVTAVWGAAIPSVLIIQIWKGLSPNEWNTIQKLLMLGIVATAFVGTARPEKYDYITRSSTGIPLEILLGSIALCLAAFFMFGGKEDG